MTSDQIKRLAFLHGESLEDWTRRFMRERDMREPAEREIAEIIRLGDIDFKSGHQ